MVDLDNLGRTPAVYALAQSDNTLAIWLQAAAHSLQLATPPLVDATTAGLRLKNSSQLRPAPFKKNELEVEDSFSLPDDSPHGSNLGLVLKRSKVNPGLRHVYD
jgi:hypothetical protein